MKKIPIITAYISLKIHYFKRLEVVRDEGEIKQQKNQEILFYISL